MLILALAGLLEITKENAQDRLHPQNSVARESGVTRAANVTHFFGAIATPDTAPMGDADEHRQWRAHCDDL